MAGGTGIKGKEIRDFLHLEEKPKREREKERGGWGEKEERVLRREAERGKKREAGKEEGKGEEKRGREEKECGQVGRGGKLRMVAQGGGEERESHRQKAEEKRRKGNRDQGASYDGGIQNQGCSNFSSIALEPGLEAREMRGDRDKTTGNQAEAESLESKLKPLCFRVLVVV
ncbi:octapeptide-repeat protein T2-like isoform X1 [Carica papaya]|uniref:octapeptide-repeat protein T2-like isoform X1 n=1 Tax=Carica papaya TaxID=3649 RepID=UPI000B8C8F2D|nr:octapeptide-repeat protein T2-like isoform X1 [Carica papaya]